MFLLNIFYCVFCVAFLNVTNDTLLHCETVFLFLTVVFNTTILFNYRAAFLLSKIICFTPFIQLSNLLK